MLKFHHFNFNSFFLNRLVWRENLKGFGDTEKRVESGGGTKEALSNLAENINPNLELVNKAVAKLDAPNLPKKELEIRTKILHELGKLYSDSEHINYGLKINGKWEPNAGLEKHLSLFLSVWEKFDRDEKYEGHKNWEKKVYYRNVDMYDDNAANPGETLKERLQRRKDQVALRKLERDLRKQAKEEGIATEPPYGDRSNKNRRAEKIYEQGLDVVKNDRHEVDVEKGITVLSEKNISNLEASLDQFEQAIEKLPKNKERVNQRLVEDLNRELANIGNEYEIMLEKGYTYEPPDLAKKLEDNVARSKELLARLQPFRTSEAINAEQAEQAEQVGQKVSLDGESETPEISPEAMSKITEFEGQLSAFVEGLEFIQLEEVSKQIKDFRDANKENLSPQAIADFMASVTGINIAGDLNEFFAALISFNRKTSDNPIGLDVALKYAKDLEGNNIIRTTRELTNFSNELIKKYNTKGMSTIGEEPGQARSAEREAYKNSFNFENLYNSDPQVGAEEIAEAMNFAGDFNPENLTAATLREELAFFVERFAKYHWRRKQKFEFRNKSGEMVTETKPVDERRDFIHEVFANPYGIDSDSLTPLQEKQIIKSFQQFLVNETGIKIEIDGIVGPETTTLMNAWVKTLVGPNSPEASMLDPKIRYVGSDKETQRIAVQQIENQLKSKKYVEKKSLERAEKLQQLLSENADPILRQKYTDEMIALGYAPKDDTPQGSERIEVLDKQVEDVNTPEIEARWKSLTKKRKEAANILNGQWKTETDPAKKEELREKMAFVTGYLPNEKGEAILARFEQARLKPEVAPTFVFFNEDGTRNLENLVEAERLVKEVLGDNG